MDLIESDEALTDLKVPGTIIMYKIHEKKYLVAIPIPSLDKEGRILDESEVEEWTLLAQVELSECFGGATPIPAPGTNILNGKILYEKGQNLVLSACDRREDYLAKRNRIQAFAARMAQALNQYAVFVLACPSDSFLVEE